MHMLPVGRRRDHLGGGAPRGPVAQIPSGDCGRVLVLRALRRGQRRLRALELGLDLLEAGLGHIIRMRGDRPVRQFIRQVVFPLLHEGAAHQRNMGGDSGGPKDDVRFLFLT